MDASAGAPARVVVITGPEANVDRDNLDRWCREWGDELGADVDVRFADGRATLIEALAPAAVAPAAGVVLCPAGAAGDEAVHDAADRCGVPVAWLDLIEAERPRSPHLRPTATSVRGRGVAGYRWALAHLLQRLSWPYSVLPYGAEPDRDRVGDLRLPAGGTGPYPVAVFLHGGFWRERWERDTIEPLAVDLARRGYATWNLEYRRTGPFGGGWPATGEDVAAGVDALADMAGKHRLDLDRVVLVGHSAGGQLALWAVKRDGVPAPPRVRPRLIVSLAGVPDLVECSRRGLGDTGNAAAAFVGGAPELVADRYRQASPIAALPLGVPQLVVQGRLDNIADLVDLNRSYVRAARAAGDAVELLELDDADHFDLIDPASEAWRATASRIDATLGTGLGRTEGPVEAGPADAAGAGPPCPPGAEAAGPLDYPTPRALAERVRDAAARLPQDTPPGHGGRAGLR